MTDAVERGTGWKPDTEEHVRAQDVDDDLSLMQKFGMPHVAKPRAKSNLAMLPLCIYRDQRSTSECVAFGLTNAAFIRLCAIGVMPAEPFSPHLIYKPARMLERTALGRNRETGEFPPLDDSGSYPFLALTAGSRYGFAPDSADTFDELTVNNEPDLMMLQRASQFRIQNFTRFDDSELALRHKRVLDCIDAMVPVPLGMRWGKQASNYRKGLGPIEPSRDGTGHYTVLIGYEDYGEVLVGLNSWGRDYGDNGLYRITRAKLEDPSTTDIVNFVIANKRAA